MKNDNSSNDGKGSFSKATLHMLSRAPQPVITGVLRKKFLFGFGLCKVSAALDLANQANSIFLAPRYIDATDGKDSRVARSKNLTASTNR